MSRDKALAVYFADAASWDADRVAQGARSLRLVSAVAIAGWLCALAGLGTVLFLTPLKTVVPYVIRVDNSTGVIDVVPQYVGPAQLPEITTRQLLRQYIQVCERFVWALAEADYDECGAFNSPRLNQTWAASWATSNPDSPLNRYKDGSSVVVRVTSLSFIQRASGANDLAQVRYVKARKSIDGAEDSPTQWIATLQYTYVSPSKDPKTKGLNPLGFRIVEFRREPESATDAANASARDSR